MKRYVARHAQYTGPGTQAVAYPDDMANLIALSIAKRLKDRNIKKVHLYGFDMLNPNSRFYKTADIVAQELNIEFDKTLFSGTAGQDGQDYLLIGSQNHVLTNKCAYKDIIPGFISCQQNDNNGGYRFANEDIPTWTRYDMYKCVADGMDFGDKYSGTIDYLLHIGEFDKNAEIHAEPWVSNSLDELNFCVLSPYFAAIKGDAFVNELYNILFIYLSKKKGLTDKDILLKNTIMDWVKNTDRPFVFNDSQR